MWRARSASPKKRPPTKNRSPTTTPRSEETVALSLGANAGDPQAQLLIAVRALGRVVSALMLAPLFRTEPVSTIAQPDYFNTALVGRTSLAPDEILAFAKSLEWAAGRRPAERFGPRPLDVDLLLYGDRVSHAPELTLPHPRLAERRFYLEPLARIAPGLRVPPAGMTVAELLAAAPVQEAVEELEWSLPERGL